MPYRLVLALFCSGVVFLAFFYRLGNLSFLGADEARYARIGEEMNLRSEYVTPTLEFRPWLEKPPLLFWSEAISFRLFGVSEWAARFPVALLAMAGVFVTGALLMRERGRRPAMLAILFLSTSGLYFIYGRAASTDMPLSVLFTAALVTGFLAARSKKPVWAVLCGLCLGLSVLAKGPVAFILFWGIMVLYSFFRRQYGWTILQTIAGGLVFVAVSVPWFWLVWKENGYDFVATFWLNHHLARFVTSIHHHDQPFWYFIPILLLGAFPWSGFLGSAALRVWRSRGARDLELEVFLWLWLLVPLVFFSVAESKLPGYILPVVPAVAALAALEWDRFLSAELTSYRLMKIQIALIAAFGVVISVAVAAGFHFAYRSLEAGIILSVPLLAGVLWAQFEFRRRRPAGSLITLVAAMTLMTALLYWKGAAVVEKYHSARDLSLLAGPLVSKREPLVLFRYFHHTAQYYTGYETTREALRGGAELRDYMSRHPQEKYLILTQDPGWIELQQEFALRLLHREGNLYLVEVRFVDQ